MKASLKKQIRHIISGKTDPETITSVIIIDDTTGERIVIGKPLNDKKVKVDSSKRH